MKYNLRIWIVKQWCQLYIIARKNEKTHQEEDRLPFVKYTICALKLYMHMATRRIRSNGYLCGEKGTTAVPIFIQRIYSRICLAKRFLQIVYDDRKHHRNSGGSVTRYSHFRRAFPVIWYRVSTCLPKDINETIELCSPGVNNLCLFAWILIFATT